MLSSKMKEDITQIKVMSFFIKIFKNNARFQKKQRIYKIESNKNVNRNTPFDFRYRLFDSLYRKLFLINNAKFWKKQRIYKVEIKDDNKK